MSKPKSVPIGTRFGTLVVVSECFSHNSRMSCLCECDCGKVGRRALKDLLAKKTNNCGCLRGARFRSITAVKRELNPNFRGHGEISKYVWSGWKGSAKKRNIPFTITIEEAWQKFLYQNRSCALSGVAIRFASCREFFDEKTASMDRIDNSVGYTKENVQWVHKDLNAMRRALTVESFVRWCDLVVQHNSAILNLVE